MDNDMWTYGPWADFLLHAASDDDLTWAQQWTGVSWEACDGQIVAHFPASATSVAHDLILFEVGAGCGSSEVEPKIAADTAEAIAVMFNTLLARRKGGQS